jgi:hypothetical protein
LEALAFWRDLDLGIGDLCLLRGERFGVIVARQSTGGDRRLQSRAGLIFGVEIAFKQMTLQRCLGVNE